MRRIWLLISLFLVVSGGQAFAQYPLGGASKPKPQLKISNLDKQYKRIHQFSLRMIEKSRFDEAQEVLEEHLQNHPEDPESHFMLGVLYARQRETDRAIDMLRKAVELGLPAERIVAGPRDMLQAVADHPFMAKLKSQCAAAPLHGPMVGNVTDDSASIWVRTGQESRVQIFAAEAGDPANEIRSGSVTSADSDDFTTVVTLAGLKTNTKYNYILSVDGERQKVQPAHQYFWTFPKQGESCRFQIAFGGGAGYVPPHERMWGTIGQFDPLALLLLGDNTYIDDPESVAMQKYTYYRRQSRPEFRHLTARTAVFSIWDDHDFGTNDCWGGPSIDVPFWKKDYSWKIFRQNWPNPGFGGGEEQPGCWYNFSIGDVDFVMLDCRYYRESPRKEDPSMLGPKQMAWFKKTLLAQRGTFKVLCSSVPWDFRTKGDSLDTWNGYQAERDEIFGFIETNRIEGVVLMSADRHRSDAWQLERDNGYDFYELNSSRLTNQHVHPTMTKAGAIFSYNAKQSFGLVSFDTQASDPVFHYDVINIDGKKIDRLTVKRSQLEY